MNKLKLIDDGVEKKIEYTEKLAKGIFKVTENKVVKRNCEVLNIIFDAPMVENQLMQRISKIGKAGILTMRVSTTYLQFIFMNYTEPEDFEFLLREMDTRSHEPLKAAFNMAKLNSLADLENILTGLHDPSLEN